MAKAVGYRLQDMNALLCNFRTDAVAGKNCEI
jgi:hypothetical protein